MAIGARGIALALLLITAGARAQQGAPASGAEAGTGSETAAEAEAESESESESWAESEAETEGGAETGHLPDPRGGGSSEPEDARGHARGPGTEPEDVLLAVPRALLFLPGFVLDVAFFPLREGMKLSDRYHLADRVRELLYFDDAHTIGWSPSVRVLGSQGVSAGVTLFDNDLLDHGESLQASARYGGHYTQFYELAFEGDGIAGGRIWSESRLRYEANPGLLFGGIGIVAADATGTDLDPRSSNRRRYFSQERALGLVRGGYAAVSREGRVKVGGSLIANHRHFEDNDRDRSQTSAVYDVSQLSGYQGDINTLELTLNLIADYRRTTGLDSTGPYLELFWGGVPALDGHRYVHYGGEVAYTIDLFRGTRLLSLRTALEAVDGDADEIPFTDLPRLGGPHRLRGYQLDRFRDKRAALASAEYHYPIHRNILGQLFIDGGYVSDHYGDLYALEDWKVGYGGGIIAGGEHDITFRLDISYGEDLLIFLSGELPAAFDGRSSQL